MRRSRTVLPAVSTALRAAASQDSLLTPITSVTRYTPSAIGLSLCSTSEPLTLALLPFSRRDRRVRARAARVGATALRSRGTRGACGGRRGTGKDWDELPEARLGGPARRPLLPHVRAA